MEEQTDAGTFAYQLVEHVADRVGEEHADAYLAEVVYELFELVPGLRQRFSHALLAELKEEIARKEDPKHSHATIQLIHRIENDWRSND